MSVEGQQLEGLVGYHIAAWVLANLAGILGVNSQLRNYQVYHILHPDSAEPFEGIQQLLLADALAPVGAFLSQKLPDDSLDHFGPVVVMLF